MSGKISMGCQVEMDVCSEPSVARATPVFDFTMSPTFLYASVVSAPQCNSCGNAMAVHADTDWVCTTDDCQAEGFVVAAPLLGVFPAKQV